MILAIDIGNTTVSLAICQKQRAVETASICARSSDMQLLNKFRFLLSHFLRTYGGCEAVVICSVVPSLTKKLEAVIKKEWAMSALIIGRDVKVPLKSRYNPKQIGQDRLVCAYAAKMLYGQPVIVIDFGTATTFDVVNHRGEYAGGVIVPGLRLSTETLFHKTALLPKIENIKPPKHLIGRNTQDSILSGLLYGYGTMSAGLIDLIKKRIKGKPTVIITGGYTKLMKKYIHDHINIIDDHLVFKGNAMIRCLSR